RLELFTLDEVASRFRVSRRSFQSLIRQHPYYRTLGRRKLFTETDIGRLYEALSCPSNSFRPAAARRPIGQSAARTSANMWTEAQRLLNEQPRNKSLKNGSGKSSRTSSPSPGKRPS